MNCDISARKDIGKYLGNKPGIKCQGIPLDAVFSKESRRLNRELGVHKVNKLNNKNGKEVCPTDPFDDQFAIFLNSTINFRSRLLARDQDRLPVHSPLTSGSQSIECYPCYK